MKLYIYLIFAVLISSYQLAHSGELPDEVIGIFKDANLVYLNENKDNGLVLILKNDGSAGPLELPNKIRPAREIDELILTVQWVHLDEQKRTKNLTKNIYSVKNGRISLMIDNASRDIGLSELGVLWGVDLGAFISRLAPPLKQ